MKLRSATPFQGREALERQGAAPLPCLLAGFTLDDPTIVLLGREMIFRNGERVGWLTSGGFGHTLGRPIGYGYVRHPEGVDRDFILSGSYELEIATERVPAQITLDHPPYDPEGRRVRG